MDTDTGYLLLLKYIQGDCKDDEYLKILNWIDASRENKEFYYNLKAIWYAKKVESYSQHLDIPFEKFKKKVHKIERKRIWGSFYKYAAILILCIGISIFLKNQYFGKTEMIVCKVPNSSDILLVVLSDSTKVWLNKQSTLTYPVKFGKKSRQVYLSGEAYFEVKTDPSWLFEVKTPAITVKVLGTSFNLKLLPGNKIAETTLSKGKVALFSGQGEHFGEMLPGEQTLFHSQNQVLTKRKVDTQLYTAWHLGTTLLNNASLNDIALAIESLYKIKVIVKAPALETKKYKFTLHKGQSIETVLEMLQFVATVKYVKAKDRTFIISQ